MAPAVEQVTSQGDTVWSHTPISRPVQGELLASTTGTSFAATPPAPAGFGVGLQTRQGSQLDSDIQSGLECLKTVVNGLERVKSLAVVIKSDHSAVESSSTSTGVYFKSPSGIRKLMVAGHALCFKLPPGHLNAGKEVLVQKVECPCDEGAFDGYSLPDLSTFRSFMNYSWPNTNDQRLIGGISLPVNDVVVLGAAKHGPTPNGDNVVAMTLGGVTNLSVGCPILVVGWDESLDKWCGREGQVVGSAGGFYMHDANTKSGYSGGPVFDVSTSTWTMVGIHSGGSPGAVGGLGINYFQALDSIQAS